jgi:hypothetical protein
MISKELLLSRINMSTVEFVEQTNTISDEDFNKKHNEDTWSAGEIAEHILLLETKINLVFSKAHLTQRPPDLKLDAMRSGVLSQETKYPAPEPFHPSPGVKNKNDIVSKLKIQREILKENINKMDLTETLDIKHPYIGSMTRLEWAHFIIYHCRRHLDQMRMRIVKSELN